MFQRLILQWLAARTVETVKQQAIKEIFSPAEPRPEPDSLACVDRPDAEAAQEKSKSPSEKPEVDFGFVFAMPMEAAGVADRLKQKKTTRGDDRTFHSGFFGDGHNERRVTLVESGVGQEKAARATEVLIDLFQPKRIVSTGYGGGLSKRLKRFNVCFPEMLVRESDGARLDLSEAIPKQVSEPVRNRLTLLTTDFVVATPKQKARLCGDTGAELVDMETFAVADICRCRRIPFLSVRIILDTAEEELPKDIQGIMKNAEIGGARLAGSVVGSLFSRPSSVLDLFTLKQRALEATDRLAKKLTAELQD